MARFFINQKRRRAELLSAYIDGRLAPKEGAYVERMVAASAEWRKELESLRATVSLLRQAPRPQPRRSFALTEAMVEAGTRRVVWPGLRAAATAATAVAAILLAFSLVGGTKDLFSRSASPIPAPSPSQAPKGEVAVPTAAPPLATTAGSADGLRQQASPSAAVPAPSPTAAPFSAAAPAAQATGTPAPTPAPAPTATARSAVAPAAPAFTPTATAATPAAVDGTAPRLAATPTLAPRSVTIAGEAATATPTATAAPTATPAPTPTAISQRDLRGPAGPAGPAGVPGGPKAGPEAPSAQGPNASLPTDARARGGRSFPWLPLEIGFAAATGVLALATVWLFVRARSQSRARPGR